MARLSPAAVSKTCSQQDADYDEALENLRAFIYLLKELDRLREGNQPLEGCYNPR